jgi:hypothetical protein
LSPSAVAQIPEQHGVVVEHAWSTSAQVAVGGSQKHPMPSGSVQSTRDPLVSVVKQPRPEQHASLGEQDWAISPQVGAGGRQTPERQASVAVQQSVAVAQPWPVAEHVAAPELQVPLVAPAGTSQASPAQQSEATVQLAASGWQATRQVPVASSQPPEQHCASVVQALPFGAQIGVAQKPETQLPEQHCASPVHAMAFARQPPPPPSPATQ